MAQKKQRLDQRVQQDFPEFSRQQIQSWIMQGKVTVEKQIVNKPGAQVRDDQTVILNAQEPKFVSRAGFKLEKALDSFGLDVAGMVVLDAGISTGGFTDCLLQRGAQRVYGVDVGYGQVHNKIEVDPRVVLMERTNLRELQTLPENVDLVTLDLSFISALKVMDAVKRVMKDTAHLILLIKPQFEAQRNQVGKGGIIKDSLVHREVIDRVVEGMRAHGFVLHGVIESPLLGGSGNKEFLGYFSYNRIPLAD